MENLGKVIGLGLILWAMLPSVARPATLTTQPAALFGLIGDRLDNLPAQHDAGINAKVVRLSWKDYFPQRDQSNAKYLQSKRDEFTTLHSAGFQVIADLGLHDIPPWVHLQFTDNRYVDQFGDSYNPGIPDSGDANLVFNPQLRQAAEQYVADVFKELGTQIDMVRLGWGHWGELTYPEEKDHGHTNCYWAFDALALQSNPVPTWRPGQPSPNGEAGKFLNWYLDRLVDFQNWQIATVRGHFAGPLLMLYPSWGIRPGQIDAAIAGNLSGRTSAEINGEMQRGYDFVRQINAIHDPGVVVTCTWLDADGSNDDGPNQQLWSPIHYLATLADAHQPPLAKFGENTGQGSPAKMDFSMRQVQRFGLRGLEWFSENELGKPGYATLADYQRQIAPKPAGGQ